MWPWILAAAGLLVVLILLWFRWLASQPVYHRNERLDNVVRYLQSLVELGGDGCVMYMDHEGGNAFLQFVKKGHAATTGHIHFGFPDATWSRPHFQMVKENLKAAGFHVSELQSEQEDVRRFATIDNLNVSEAAKVAHVAAEAMQLRDATFTIHYKGPGLGGEQRNPR